MSDNPYDNGSPNSSFVCPFKGVICYVFQDIIQRATTKTLRTVVVEPTVLPLSFQFVVNFSKMGAILSLKHAYSCQLTKFGVNPMVQEDPR